MNRVFIGTAGWSLSKENKVHFGETGPHLQRYAGRFNLVEINSSFYREHKAATYAKWAALTPANFRFSVKLNKAFTHVHKLQHNNSELSLAQSLNGIMGLGEKLGYLLVQIPPGLQLDLGRAEEFFAALREIYPGALAFEPRHPSWNNKNFLKLEKEYKITRVWADPDPAGCNPAGSSYLRLHGSPVIYKSDYDDGRLEALAKRLRGPKSDVFCVFDNTTFGTATLNALKLRSLLAAEPAELAP